MATGVVARQSAAQDQALANMQRNIDQTQQQYALIIQALLNVIRGQWDSAHFGPESAEAVLVALNPTLQGKVNPVAFRAGPVAGPAELTTLPVRRRQNPNCWYGRPYGPPVAFVLHTESGGESGTVAELLSSSAKLSAHYAAGLDGKLENWIDAQDRAWSNGILEPGNVWAWIARQCGIDPALDPNHVTVTCETEDQGDPDQAVSDKQFESVMYAAGEAKRRYPNSLRYLVKHSDISPQSRHSCPGDRWLASGRFHALADATGLKVVSS